MFIIKYFWGCDTVQSADPMQHTKGWGGALYVSIRNIFDSLPSINWCGMYAVSTGCVAAIQTASKPQTGAGLVWGTAQVTGQFFKVIFQDFGLPFHILYLILQPPVPCTPDLCIENKYFFKILSIFMSECKKYVNFESCFL